MKATIGQPEKWSDIYESASDEQRYRILLDTLDKKLSVKFLKRTDFSGCLLDMIDVLVNLNLIDDIIPLLMKLKEKQPDIYKKVFKYCDDFLMDYYLFKKEPEKVRESMSRFIEDPVPGIDHFFAAIDKLIFYGYTDFAVQTAKKSYEAVKREPDVIPGAEDELSDVIFFNMFNHSYELITIKENVDWQQMMDELEKYDCIRVEKTVKKVKGHLTNIQQDMEFATELKKDLRGNLSSLFWEYLKYMHDQKDMDFVCSHKIWMGFQEFLDEQNASNVLPDRYFDFDERELESYLADLLRGFLSLKQAEAFAILWGIPHIYDYLLSQSIIKEELHKRTMGKTKSLKSKVKRSFKEELWKYHFVHQCKPPACISEKTHNAESKKFSDSIKIQGSLSRRKSKR